ncbi:MULTISPECIES: ATP-dependent helicase [Aeromonas]|nr:MULTISPECIES: ATP-dependent helicase [Aeromonas]HDT5895304.1 ATP-dependent helicase [Aeromonas hydrophila subsp. hydrophila]AXB03296.1 ATP-dependent helicase [Aeromonas caviae]MEA9442831.1 ATP-dependent helicase [Aeromonas caviae]ONG02555.1 DNA helicase UvrD [Aeromonas hydrophila]RCE14178.1 ATP-dependent helicase [Aeromonas caviae]
MNLSNAQRQIVEAPLDIAIQVLASAGSGKTRVLTERIRHILQTTKKEGVIALTFTNKAADEMSARLADSEQAEERVWIATIHSIAQRILEKYGHTVGLPAELHIYDRDKDRMEVFMQSLREDGIDIDDYLNISDSKELKSRERNLQSYMDIFSKIKRELLTESEVAELYPNNNIWKIYKDYQSALLNSGGIDYDDILVCAYKILLDHDWIAKIYRSQYKHVCVDEAQDLNKAQYEFIKVLCGDVIKSVLMVGDPNQMIYGFNGSSKDYLCSRFVEDFTPQKFELKENYRSTKAVINAANKLRPGSQTEMDYALEGGIKISEFDSEENEAAAIVATIKYLLELKVHDEIEGEISLSNMVVIGRNRFVFSKLEQCLQDNSIPYSLRKGERQLEPSTRFGKVLDYAIRVKLNSKDWVDGKKLCQVLGISEPDNWSKNVLQNLAVKISLSSDDYSEIFQKLLSAIDNLDVDNPKLPKLVKDFNALLSSLVENQDGASDERTEDVKLSLEELDEFNRTWTRFKRKGLGDSLVAFRNALALGQLSDNALDDGLTLSTVHTMKGLEKDIVFLIGMCEGVFPDYRANTTEALDEERNNAFVAVTRAKRWLYVSYPKQRMMPWGDLKFQRKSRFVAEIES